MSKSLLAQRDVFNKMGERVSISDHETTAVSFMLSGPIQFVDSKLCGGVQLADVVAASFRFAYSNTEDEHALKWRKYIPEVACCGSVIPEPRWTDLDNPKVALNAIILDWLCMKSKNGESLVDNVEVVIDNVSRYVSKA